MEQPKEEERRRTSAWHRIAGKIFIFMARLMKTSRERAAARRVRRVAPQLREKVEGEITTNGVFVPVLRSPLDATGMMRYGR